MTFRKMLIATAIGVATLSCGVWAQDQAAQPAPNPEVFATINGEILSKNDFYTNLENYPVRTQTGSIPAGTQVAESMINDALILQYAKKNEVSATDAQINAKLGFITKQYGNIDFFLMQSGMTLDEFKHKLAVEQSFVNVLTKGINITDANVKSKYDELLKAPKSQFKAPDEANIAFIVTSDANKAQKAYAKLKTGADFNKTAAQFSDDPSAKSGKNISGWVNSATEGFPADVFKAAYKLEKGKYTTAIKTTDKKWYIVKLLDKKAGKVTPLDDVKELLKEQLAMEKAGSNPKVMEGLQEFIKTAAITMSSPKYQALADSIKAKAANETEKKPTEAGNNN